MRWARRSHFSNRTPSLTPPLKEGEKVRVGVVPSHHHFLPLHRPFLVLHHSRAAAPSRSGARRRSGRSRHRQSAPLARAHQSAAVPASPTAAPAVAASAAGPAALLPPCPAAPDLVLVPVHALVLVLVLVRRVVSRTVPPLPSPSPRACSSRREYVARAAVGRKSLRRRHTSHTRRSAARAVGGRVSVNHESLVARHRVVRPRLPQPLNHRVQPHGAILLRRTASRDEDRLLPQEASRAAGDEVRSAVPSTAGHHSRPVA